MKKQKKYFFVFNFIALLMMSFFSLVGCGRKEDSSATSLSSTLTIVIPRGAAGRGSDAYIPNPVHVSVGGKVVWFNDDRTPHSATSDTGVFTTGLIPSSASSAEIVFHNPGTYPYHCAVQGAVSMSGTIIVP